MTSTPYLRRFILITSLIILLDQVFKFFILNTQPNLDWKIVAVHLIKNTGAGFGLLKGQQLLLTLISLSVALALIIFYHKIPKEKIPQLLFALFLGGTIGNLIDRAFRHYVIDFIDLKIWPAFNIADASITIASIGLIIYFWKEK